MTKHKKDSITIAIPSVDLQPDPHKMEDIQSMFLVQQIHRSLFRFKSDGTVESDLVSKVEFSRDRTRARLTLKSIEHFSDGSIIEPKHVVASLKRPFLVGSSIVGDLSYFKGAREAILTKSVESLRIIMAGPNEIEIELESPSDLLSTHLALPDLAIVKIENANDPLPVGVYSGPFRILSKTDSEIILEKWNSPIAQQKIVLRAVPSEQVFENAKNGAVDSIEQYSITADQKDELTKKGWKRAVHSLSYENFLLMNPSKIPKAVRRTISSRIHSDRIAQELGMEPAYGLIPTNLPGSLATPHVRDDAPYSESTGTYKFEIAFNKANYLHARFAEILRRELESVGIAVDLVALEHEKFYETLFARKATAIIAGKGIDYPDGLANLAYFRTDVPNNFLFMENSDLDKEIRDLSLKPYEQRIVEYEQIQKRILNQDTVVPLFFGHATSGLWGPNVPKVPSHPFGFQFLKLDELEP